MRSARTLAAQYGPTRAAKILGVAPSTLARWRDGQFQSVKRSTRKLENQASIARRKAAAFARSHKARPVTGVPVVPKAARIKRLDYGKLNQPKPGGGKYRREDLPRIDASTVAHGVKGFSRDDVLMVLAALRDRGSKFRMVFQTPKGDKRYPSRKGSTAPIDPEDMSDDDLADWLNASLKGGVYRPLYVMEME